MWYFLRSMWAVLRSDSTSKRQRVQRHRTKIAFRCATKAHVKCFQFKVKIQTDSKASRKSYSFERRDYRNKLFPLVPKAKQEISSFFVKKVLNSSTHLLFDFRDRIPQKNSGGLVLVLQASESKGEGSKYKASTAVSWSVVRKLNLVKTKRSEGGVMECIRKEETAIASYLTAQPKIKMGCCFSS